MNEFYTSRSIDHARDNFEFDKQIPENKNMYDKPRKRMIKPLKIILIVIASIVCAYILYSVLVNPMTQLQIHTLFFPNGKITVSASGFDYYDKSTVFFDKNLLYSRSTKDYYLIKDDSIYVYEKSASGTWETSLVPPSNDDVDIPEALLYGRNYKRVGLLTWELKKNVDSGDLREIRCKKLFGQYIITGYIGFAKVKIKIHSIGFVDIDLPWEK